MRLNILPAVSPLPYVLSEIFSVDYLGQVNRLI